jgi:hypothetical protein
VKPLVLIAANPYDAEVIRKIVDDAGCEARIVKAEEPLFGQGEPAEPIAAFIMALRSSTCNVDSLLRPLCSGALGKKVPIIFIRDSEQPLSSNDAQRLGISALISRPIDSILLTVTLNKVLQSPASAPSKASSLLNTAITASEPKHGLNSSHDVLVKDIITKHQLVVEGDYFSLLELDLDSTAEQVPQAYQRLKEHFDPDRLPLGITEVYGEMLVDILEVLEEAYKVLKQEDLRRAYRETLL